MDAYSAAMGRVWNHGERVWARENRRENNGRDVQSENDGNSENSSGNSSGNSSDNPQSEQENSQSEQENSQENAQSEQPDPSQSEEADGEGDDGSAAESSAHTVDGAQGPPQGPQHQLENPALGFFSRNPDRFLEFERDHSGVRHLGMPITVRPGTAESFILRVVPSTTVRDLIVLIYHQQGMFP
jgi:hypothetical protein